jgi:hypothetical protein
LLSFTNCYSNPVIALGISIDGERIIAGTDKYVPGSPSSLLILIDSAIGKVLSIKEYVYYSSKLPLHNNPHNLLMVDSDYQIYQIMAFFDPSRTQQWQGFRVFKLDP